MDDQKRGDDAADHAPRPGGKPGKHPPGTSPSGKQDAPNYDERADGDRAVPTEDLSSANDE